MSTQKLFFSYSRFDSNFALKLAKDLREAGADIWIDQLDIPAGNHWDSAVEGALSSAACVLVILSPSSTASTNVMDEVSFALESGKKIIPVLLDDCLAPFRLRRLQRIDFTSDYSVGFNQLVQALNLAVNAVSKQEDAAHDANQSNASGSDSASKEVHGGDEWENNLWEEACRLNTIASYKNYLNQSVKGENKGEARLLIKQLELQQKEDEVEALLWQKAKSENSKNLYQHYLKDYPNGNFEALALAAIADIEKIEKDEQTRIKEQEKQLEKERLLKEQKEKEQKLKEENDKALREKQERERLKQEENEKALREKQERERLKQVEKEKAQAEKLEKEKARDLEKQKEKEKAQAEKAERERLKQIEKEKALLEQKNNPGKAVAGAGNKKYAMIGGGVLLLILGIWGISKMSAGGGDKEAWNAAIMKNDSAAYAGYQQKFPSGKYSVKAKSKLDSINHVRQVTRDSIRYAAVLQTRADSIKTASEKVQQPKTVTPPPPKTKATSPPKQVQKLALGQTYRGGVIIFLDPSGEHGLVASVHPEGNLNWEKAKKVCAATTTGGFAWHLPNKDELNKMYLNRKYLGVYIKGNYWSSTEENKNNAWIQNFSNGNQSKSNKQTNYAVRGVQIF